MPATNGDNVKVHYTGKLEDGTVFDTSEGREPLEFTLGEGQVIPGFESAVRGMSQGETKTTQIPADHAYGPHHAEMVLVVPRSQFPPDFNPKPGDQLEIKQEDGQSFYVHVTEIGETDIGLDANHPLAGKDLIFDIQLVQVNRD
jgi:peptidylprolyl isomerase